MRSPYRKASLFTFSFRTVSIYLPAALRASSRLSLPAIPRIKGGKKKKNGRNPVSSGFLMARVFTPSTCERMCFLIRETDRCIHRQFIITHRYTVLLVTFPWMQFASSWKINATLDRFDAHIIGIIVVYICMTNASLVRFTRKQTFRDNTYFIY